MAIVTIDNSDQVKQNDFIFSSGEAEDFVICKNPDKLKCLLQALAPGTTTHFISDGDWSMHDLTLELLKKLQPAELFITSYAIREFPIRQLILAQEKKDITGITMLLDYRAKVRTPEVYQLASINANKIGLVSLHAKVTVIKGASGSASIISSANWTQNPRIEAGIVTLDPAAAEFHITWINQILQDAEIFN